MTNTWTQQFEPVSHDKVSVSISVDSWPDAANKQLSTFVRDLIAQGVTLSGGDGVLALTGHS